MKKYFILVFFVYSIAFSQNQRAWVTSTNKAPGNDVSYSSQGKDDEGTYEILTNWSQGWMEFSASTTADLKDAANPGQAEYLATTGARMLAYGRAAEFISGVAVDGMAGVDRGIVKVNTLTAKFSGMVRNAVVISEECVWKTGPGGSQYPWATVRVGILLYGDNPSNLLSLFIDDANTAYKASGYSEYKPTQSETQNVQNRMSDLPATGIIIDTRGFSVNPSLSPLILVEGPNKKVVYSGSTVSRDYAIKQGIAGYVRSEEQASKDDRLKTDGNYNPLTVKASSVKDNVIYLSPEDAALAAAADMKTGILDQCKVLIMVD